MKTIRNYLTMLMLLVVHAMVAQPDTLLVPSTLHLGAGWGSNGGYTTFGMAGQYVQGKIAGGDYTGKIGYLLGDLTTAEENLPPIASAPTQRFFYELGEVLVLDGYDPEEQPIEFEITVPPTKGSLVLADGVNTQEVIFTPNSGLLPGTTYLDEFTFQVNETNTAESSDPATVLFKFTLEDTEHEVTDLTKSGSTFTVTFADTVFNANYGIDVNYYNISDPLNAQFINIQNGSISQESLTIGSLSGSYSFDVDETANSYLFNADQVLVTVLVTTPNSYSSFNSFIIDNAAGGRILASEDGDYFVVGSDLSVPENKSAKVKLIAVDFAGFEAEPTIEWTKNPTQGVLGGFTLVESSQYMRIWESKYTSTQDIGAEDDFSFRVFNSIRNSYESATINMSVQDVNDVPKLAAIPNQQLVEDGSKTVSLTYSDPDNDLIVSASSNNTALLTASIVDGQLSLQAIDGKSGSTTVRVWVEESAGDDPLLVLKQLNVTVTPVNDAPVLAAIGDQSGDEDVTIEVPLVATDVDGDVVFFSYETAIDDPTLATVSTSGNTLSIVPRANANGTAQVSVTADDGSGASNALSNTVTFNVTFNAVNDLPEFLKPIPDQTLIANSPSYNLNMGDFVFDAETDVSALTYSTSASTKVTINFTGEIATITPITDQSGAEFITFTIKDAENQEISQSVFFNVRPLNTGDIEVDQQVSDLVLDEDFGTYSIDITSAFRVKDGIEYLERGDIDSYLFGNTLFDVTIDNDNNVLTLHSIENVSSETSEEVLLLGASTGPGVYQTFNVTITPVNDPPMISAVATQTVKEDGVLENLLIEIEDPEGDSFTYTVVSGDQTLLTDANIVETSNQGNFYFLSMTPEADQNGSTTITITADDGDTSVETFVLNVSSVNDLPYVIGSLADLNQDGSFNTDITTLFDDIDSESLTYEVESKPDWMTQSGNDLTGTPSNDDVGIDQVTILASDQGGSIRATFEFEIINVNDAPEVVQAAGSRLIYAGEAFTYAFPEGNFKDIDIGDDLTYTVESKPSWLTDVGGTVSGTPTNTDVGQAEVGYRATDGSGLFVEDILTINVSILSYNVTVSLTQNKSCLGGTSSVSASGAFDYNWYDANDQLVQEGGSTYESTEATTLFVVGVDGQSTETQTKFEANIDFNPLPDATLTQEDDLLKVADVEGYTYTWSLDDSNISEATGATYEPSESGSYQVVVVSDLGCSATSNALDVTIVIPEEVLGLNDPSKEVVLFPVPAREHLTLRLPESWHKGQLSVVNMQGQEVFFQSQLNSAEVKIDLADYQSGIYFVRLRVESQQLNLKFIKE
ncbi:MAG: tandem-95 repeat protein [Reichenbachiella sp.]|uniref:T9SS type A sorting domain-containing protein n=1 Tax=Reichenbachiella sp. TaxID=2184521 RepID=UPI003298AB9F